METYLIQIFITHSIPSYCVRQEGQSYLCRGPMWYIHLSTEKCLETILLILHGLLNSPIRKLSFYFWMVSNWQFHWLSEGFIARCKPTSWKSQGKTNKQNQSKDRSIAYHRFSKSRSYQIKAISFHEMEKDLLILYNTFVDRFGAIPLQFSKTLLPVTRCSHAGLIQRRELSKWMENCSQNVVISNSWSK